MAGRKPTLNAIIGTREVMAILGCDRASAIRWGREGRIKIIGQLDSGENRSGAMLFDRASVELFAADRELKRRLARKDNTA